MKFLFLLIALCAVFATSNAQFCQNIFGKSFYFQEVEQLCESFAQYNDYNQYWEYVFPQWDYDFQTWKGDIESYANNSFSDDIIRHVIEYRESYTDFYISTLANTQQHQDWAAANFTFIEAEIILYLFQLDAALKMADLILSARPECGMSDRQNLISEAVSNTSNYVDIAFNGMISGNLYNYGMVNANFLDNFLQLYHSAMTDMFSPMDAIEFLELHYLEPSRALLHNELDNMSQSMMFNINSGIVVSLINERAWLLDLLQTVDHWQCYENVNQ